jgi:hypothetical protein
VKKRFALLEIFKRREPRLLITSQTVSGFREGIAHVAFILLVLGTTYSVSDSIMNCCLAKSPGEGG